MKASFDVLVIGAGPGGMAAATVAAEAGSKVCVIDGNATVGGQIWRGLRAETARKYPHAAELIAWSARLEQSGCAFWEGWEVVDTPAPGVLRMERDGAACDVGFGRLIVATGARERFLPFPGWTLPGVMGVGGMQALVKGGLDAIGKRVVLAGTGPLLLAVAAGLKDANAHVVGIYEQASLSQLAGFGVALLGQPSKLAEGARYRMRTLQAPYRTGTWVVRANGADHVERVTLSDGRKEWSVECDWLGCGFHLVPNLELPRLLGCHTVEGYVEVDALQQSSVAHVACVGELTGIGGVEKALVEGQIAGWAAVGRADNARALKSKRKRLQRFAGRMDRAFALRRELRTVATDETVICRCEDVARSSMESCANWREAKLYTRCGMGACQGRVCGAATEFLFGWEHSGTRGPVFPATVSTLATEVETPEPVRS